MLKLRLSGLLIFSVVALSACTSHTPKSDEDGLRDIIPTAEKDSGPDRPPAQLSNIQDAKPRYIKRTIAGNKSPYKVKGVVYRVMEDPTGYRGEGMASWYGKKFHGNKTSNGEVYDMYAMTGAHKTLPLPSYVRVTNTLNNKSVIVRVNDRGPFEKGREIDLSYAAAHKLDYANAGTAPVIVEYIETSHMADSSQTPVSTTVPPFPAEITGGELWLQVGAFKDFNAAKVLADKLDKNFDERIVIEKVALENAGAVYRVQVGPAENNFNEIKSKLDALGFPNSHRVFK